MKFNKFSSLMIFVSCCVYSQAFAWNERLTHNIITNIAIQNSVLSTNKGDYLSLLGFYNGLSSELSWDSSDSIKKTTIQRWIVEGARLEDAGKWYQNITGTARSLNHFHNPLQPWASAGLSDVSSGESSLLWAQDATTQAAKVGGDWTWDKIRTYYYTAMTSDSDTTRQEYFARTFRGVGQQMHLVQDASVPAHVRNDSHAQDAMGLKLSENQSLRLETWAKTYTDKIETFANLFASTPSAYYPTASLNVPISGKAPITQLTDADFYTGANPSTSLAQGLSEYTNANFASEYTIFTENNPTDDIHYFPYPRAAGTDLQTYINQEKLPETVIASDNKPDTSFWIKKTSSDGEAISHFVRPAYLTELISPLTNSKLFMRSFYLDQFCHSDYAEKLIPRAAGYSTALLDYFFRGKIELSLPARGVYALAAPDDQFKEIRVKAKNTTVSGDEMSNGSIQLVVKYNLSLADPYQSVLVDLGPDTYIVIPEKTSTLPDDQRIKEIPKEAPVELTFDLSGTPLPLWAADVSVQVVYKGQLGNEANSVAVGYKHISEPTPVDVYNNTDYTCLNGNWYRYDDPAAMAIVDSNQDGIADRSDIYPHTINNIAFLGGPANAGTLYASASNNLFSPGPLQPGQMLRMGYILTDYEYRYAINENRTGLNGDPFGHATVNNKNFSGQGFQNDMSTQDVMYMFRGNNMWWGSGAVFINMEYGIGTCTLDALNQLLGY